MKVKYLNYTIHYSCGHTITFPSVTLSKKKDDYMDCICNNCLYEKMKKSSIESSKKNEVLTTLKLI
jgi:hypothetical protein